MNTLKPKVKVGDNILRRKSNGGDIDTWVEIIVNATYYKLVQEFPEDYKQLDGSPLEMIVGLNTTDISKKIVANIGAYVNGLGRRNLGVPLADELARSQMQWIVGQILDNPNAEVDIPEYD